MNNNEKHNYRLEMAFDYRKKDLDWAFFDNDKPLEPDPKDGKFQFKPKNTFEMALTANGLGDREMDGVLTVVFLPVDKADPAPLSFYSAQIN